MHKYAYVHGDPIQGVDPTGLFSAAGAAAGIGIGIGVAGAVLFNPNVANAPGPYDVTYAETSGNIVLDVPFGLAGYGIGRFVLPKIFRFVPGFWRSSTSLTSETVEALVQTGMSKGEIDRYLAELGDVFVFRGTSAGYVSRTSQALGITPASIDPAIATVFAVESRQFGGNAVVQIASQRSIGDAGALIVGNNRRLLEREVGLSMLPDQFTRTAIAEVSVERSINALKNLGIEILAQFPVTGGSTQFLRGLRPMSPEQIRRYLELIEQ